MTPGRKRFLLGGLGSLAPIVVSIASLDAVPIGSYVEEANPYSVVGYAVRVTALFLVGGVWAYAHRSENDPVKSLQLGVVAPAMITAMIHATNLSSARADTSSSEWLISTISLVPSVHAQTPESPEPQPAPGESALELEALEPWPAPRESDLESVALEPWPAPRESALKPVVLEPEPSPWESFIKGVLGGQ